MKKIRTKILAIVMIAILIIIFAIIFDFNPTIENPILLIVKLLFGLVRLGRV